MHSSWHKIRVILTLIIIYMLVFLRILYILPCREVSLMLISFFWHRFCFTKKLLSMFGSKCTYLMKQFTSCFDQYLRIETYVKESLLSTSLKDSWSGLGRPITTFISFGAAFIHTTSISFSLLWLVVRLSNGGIDSFAFANWSGDFRRN